MKNFILFITLTSLQYSLAVNHAPLPTVDYVDLQRYQGTWYEIARFDQKFQKGKSLDFDASRFLMTAH